MTQQQNKARTDKTLRMDDTTAKQNENGKKNFKDGMTQQQAKQEWIKL